MTLDVGKTLDKYELKERIGQGGMAVVYRGVDTSLKRDVAVKVLHQHLAESDEAKGRFEREAHAVAKLRHENILEIYDFSGTDSEESYIVTEFIDGKTLKQFCAANDVKLPEIGALIALQLCRALSHAHSLGILHRDIKPENVMIRSDGVVKLMDFGIAQMIDLQRMTVTGQLLGSPAYMSPEHVEGKPLDFRSDVFAIGVVLYQLTTGSLPFAGQNPHETLKRIADGEYTAPARKNPRIGAGLARIIRTALARDRNERYATVDEMLDALEAFAKDSGLGAPDEELAAFFATPEDYQESLRKRLVATLFARGKELSDTHRTQALDALNRVLTLDPGHVEAQTLLDSLARTGWTRYAPHALVAVAFFGMAFGGLAIYTNNRSAAPATSTSTSTTKGQTAPKRTLPSPPPVEPPVIPPPPDLDAISQAAAPLPEKEPAKNPPKAKPKPKPRPKVAAPLSVRMVQLRVSPKHSEVRIGQGPWRRAQGPMLSVSLPDEETPIFVRNPLCCEEKRIKVGRDQTGPISVNLHFLPARIVPRCDWEGVGVRVDGKPARVGRPTIIPLKNTLGRKRVKVEFFNKRFHETVVDVRYNETKTVTCKD